MRTTLVLIALSVFATPGTTQTLFQVLPRKALTKQGNGINTWSLNGSTSTRNLQRNQQLIATSEVSVSSAIRDALASLPCLRSWSSFPRAPSIVYFSE